MEAKIYKTKVKENVYIENLISKFPRKLFRQSITLLTFSCLDYKLLGFRSLQTILSIYIVGQIDQVNWSVVFRF